MSASLPRPYAHQPGQFDGAYWIDEQIWGHRLYDEQTPWLALLEFLVVLQSNEAFRAAVDIKYFPQRQLLLRNIIFNNPHFAEVVRDPPLSDQDAWDKWLVLMRKGAAQVDVALLDRLRVIIPEFKDFERFVNYVRKTAIEGSSNKRWSSKFIFPFGPDALYEDLRVSEAGASNDRRFFARSGELLYMMLSRASNAQTLEQLVTARFLQSADATNKVLKLIQGDPERADQRQAGYLPHQHLPEYDFLAEDWQFLLEQPLPKHDVLPHLAILTGLHLLIYFLRRAAAQTSSDRPQFICEIVAPRRTAIRDLALRSFEVNQALPREAVASLIRNAAESAAWSEALQDPEPLAAAAKVLCDRFDWPQMDELDSISANNPNALLAELVDRALTRHRQHNGKIHGSWARNIGLSSRRGSQRVRYAPTDGFLKALVLANVGSRMEFKEFLRRLYDRYGLIIGEHQASHLIQADEADLEDFAENAIRLEERLTSLGLMRRLSDGCAYVQVPFQRSHRE